MNKLLNLLKNKVFLSCVSVGVAVIIIGSSALGIMLPSYNSWKTYYDAAIAEKEYQKYLQSLPFECLGITAELNEGVEYYANGKAKPKPEDLTVIANFTEKGVESRKILSESDYSFEVERGFAQNGGKIIVSYVFTPEPPVTEEGEEPVTPEPEIYTAEIECTLEKVIPLTITKRGEPYRVYYDNTMSFDGEGLGALVTFNDGSTELVNDSEFRYSEESLSTGTESVPVIWERGGTELEFNCPVTVVDKSEYDDGAMLSIAVFGDTYIDIGEDLSNAKPTVRATHSSGNRLLVDERDYTVKGERDRATFTDKCVILVSHNSNPLIFTRSIVTVKASQKFADVNVELADSLEVNASQWQNGSLVTDDFATNVIAPRDGSDVKMTFTCDVISKPEMSVRVALKKDETAYVNLAQVMKISVNGNAVEFNDDVMFVKQDGEQGKYVFYEVALPMPVFRNADNILHITFSGEDASKILLDRINLKAAHNSKFYNSTEEYLVENSNIGNNNAKYVTTAVKDWAQVGGAAYATAICSDGTYMYMLITADNGSVGGMRPGIIVKCDLTTKQEVAKTQLSGQAVFKDASAGLTYYDGKIIAFKNDGSQVCVAVDSFTEGCVMQEYTGFSKIKEQVNGEILYDVYYNTVKNIFAVLTSGNKIYLFDDEMNMLKSFALQGKDGDARLSASKDYIYVNYYKDGVYQPNLGVYDWNQDSEYANNYIGKQVVPINKDDILGNELSATSKMKTSGIAIVDGDFYISMMEWDKVNTRQDTSSIWKVSMPAIDGKILPELTFDEYITECEFAKVNDLKFTGSPSSVSVDKNGSLDGTSGYGMGAVSDGRYLYVANNHASDNSNFVVSKIDTSNNACVAASAVMSVPKDVAGGDNSRLFIKDDTLYVTAGDVFSVKLDEFVDDCEFTVDEEMTALLSQNGEYRIKSACWNEKNSCYIVLVYDKRDEETETVLKGKVYLLNENGEVTTTIEPNRAGMVNSSVTGNDEYVLVSYKADKVSLKFDMFSYDGELVFSAEVDHAGVTASGWNVQAIYFHNGELHFSLCSWPMGSAHFYDFIVKPDVSILNNAS